MHKHASLSLLSAVTLAVASWAYAAAPSALAPVTAPVATPVTPAAPVNVASATMINRVVAIVNEDVITQDQLNAAINQAKMQISQSGNPVPNTLALQQQVLQQLILQTIALQLAKVNNIVVSNNTVQQTIQTLLQQDQMTQAELVQSLQQAGITLAQYQQTIRNQLIITRLEQQAVAGSIMVTPSEIDAFMAARAKLPNPDTEYDISHILLALPTNPTPAVIAEYQQKAATIVAELNAHKLTFASAAIQYSAAPDALKGGDLGYRTLNQLPTLFVKAIPNMTVGSIVGPIQDANGFHIITLDGVKTPPAKQHFVTQYQVRTIVIDTNPVMSDTHAEALLLQLKQSLQNGANFATLAADNSQDSATRTQGGNLGWVTPNTLNDAILATQIQSLPVNTISQPFKDGNTWRIIEVTATRQQNDTAEYERQQAANTLFRQKAENALQTWQDKILGESYVQIVIPELKPAAT